MGWWRSGSVLWGLIWSHDYSTVCFLLSPLCVVTAGARGAVDGSDTMWMVGGMIVVRIPDLLPAS